MNATVTDPYSRAAYNPAHDPLPSWAIGMR